MTLTYTVRPISDRAAFTRRHEGSPFTASWTDTMDLLDREIGFLRGRHVVIEVDVAERGIRADGLLRADARASSPAVRIAFESKHGPLVYATDRYIRVSGGRSSMDDWQHNVRAIALGLEALRKVDRYGISRSGEQYRGYKAIGAGSGLAPSAMTTEAAWQVLADWSDPDAHDVDHVRMWPREQIRLAKANSHPDRNAGDRTGWDEVETAVAVLTRAGELQQVGATA